MKKYDKKNDEGGMSVWKIYGLLIFVFVCLLASVLLMRYSYFADYYKEPKSLNTEKKLDSKIGKQLDNQSGESTVVITITEDDLAQALKSDESDFPLKDAKVKIYDNRIALTGKFSQGIISLKCEISLVPSVKDGKVSHEITEVKASGVKAPKIITESLNNKLSSYLDQSSSVYKDITVKEIKLFNGHLNIIGERKNDSSKP